MKYMKSKLLWFLLCLLAVGRCHAQCPGGVCPPVWQPAPAPDPAPIPANVPREAVCRVVNGSNLGSGTLIARDAAHGYVLTCAHLFREGVGQLMVRFSNGRGYPAQLLARDAVHDVALLRINRPEIEPAVFDPQSAQGMLTACGFGGNGRLHAVRGPIVGAATSAGARYPSLCLRGSVVPGDSGGPVFNAAGKVVGVVWGVRDGVTFAMHGTPVRDLLQRIVARREEAKPRDESPPRMVPVDPQPKRQESHIAKPQAAPIGDFAALTMTKLLVVSLGVSSPVSAAIIAAGFLLRRRVRHRSETKTIAVDSPPLPQQIVPETHYVPYERDAFAKAHQWAAEQVARKFPGAVEILTALDSLIKQQLNARGP
jgi:hypothetical protein